LFNPSNQTIACVAAAGIAVYLIVKRMRVAKRMPTELVSEKIKAGAKIIDVRTPEEFADGAYPKAKNIPLAVLPARMNELEPKSSPIVLYCASGARSAQAARLLKAAGFSDVTNAGGLDDMPN
jgi:phage shock protein E